MAQPRLVMECQDHAYPNFDACIMYINLISLPSAALDVYDPQAHVAEPGKEIPRKCADDEHAECQHTQMHGESSRTSDVRP